MTKVRFLHGAADRLASAADWLRSAWDARRSVYVYAPQRDVAERLDRMLWIQPATGFVPHCSGDSPLAAETPIVIDADPERSPRYDCLLNLGDEIPPGFSRFEELVEVVSREDGDRLPARERFKFYRERGYALDSQDVGGGV